MIRSGPVRGGRGRAAGAAATLGVLLGAGLVASPALDLPGTPGPAASTAAADAGRPSPTRGAVSPADFGAVGDGEADDTVALQAALDALRPGVRLVLPAGRVFRHSRVLLVRSPGSVLLGPGTLLASEEERSSLQVAADDVTVQGVRLRISATTRRWTAPDQHRLVLGPHARTVVDGVVVEGSAGAGIFVTGARDFRLTDVRVTGTRADGIHLTGGAAGGLAERPLVIGTGDDGVAVVSYQGDPAPTRDVVVSSPRVLGTSHGRGVSVVGGQDITYRDVLVTSTSAAGVYVATEGAPYFTRSTERVQVLGARIQDANLTSTVDHGAVLVFAGAADTVVADVTMEDVSIRRTRPEASRQVGVLDDAGAVQRVRLTAFDVGSGGPVFQATAPVAAYRATDWVLDGVALPDQGRA